jgi:PPOX class probable F420-dependent enzyme
MRLPVKIPAVGKRLLDGRNFASFATVMKDGSPQVSPVWIARDGDIVLVNTSVGRVKERNVLRDPRVAICVFDMENPYSKMVLRGRVLEVASEGAREHIDALSIKYTGHKYVGMKPNEKRVIFRIAPTSVNVS